MVESDLGDIIYILAIVVFGIIGALGRNKKKKGSAYPQSESKPSLITSAGLQPKIEQAVPTITEE